MISTPLPRSTPEAEGIPSRNIEAFVAELQELAKRDVQIHGYALMRRGKIISEGAFAPYPKDAAHQLFSLSKSFTSAAIGIAQGEGLLSIDEKLVDFFPEHMSPKVCERMRRVTLRNLLTMASGHAACAMDRYNEENVGSDWIKNFLEDELPLEPGEKFIYNSGATFMLSAVIRKVTGQNTGDYLRPRLFDPLGFGAVRWDKNPDGIDIGGWGMWLSTEEIAAFAQLMLQRGEWRGKQLIPRDYMALATTKQIANDQAPNPAMPDWSQGYGFQFWRCRHNCFRGDGYAGQIALALPEQDIALALTAGSVDIQAQLNAAFTHLLPHPAAAPALPADAPALAALRAREASLVAPAFAAANSAPMPDSSALFGTHAMQTNPLELESIALAPAGGNNVEVKWTRRGKTARFIASCGAPAISTTDFVYENMRLAATAHWSAADELEIRILPIGMPSLFTMRIKALPDGNGIEYSHRTPIWFKHEPLATSGSIRSR